MQIFDKELFGPDADWFMEQDCDDKKQWIKKNTNQQDDTLIDEYIQTVRRGEDECKGCKEKKQEIIFTPSPQLLNNNDVASGTSTENTENQPATDTVNSGAGSGSGESTAKKAKNK